MEKINLNSIKFNDRITREDILSCISQEQIYSYYLKEDVTRTNIFHSPLREDNIPSFSVYYHKNNSQILMFKDHATGDSGDFVELVRKKYGLSYADALKQILFDFGLLKNDNSYKGIPLKYEKVQKEIINLGIKKRNWNLEDRDYWKSYNISKKTLNKYNVVPISHIFYNNKCVSAAKKAYCYLEFKDEEPSYKIYQPEESKEKKWINNNKFSVHQGYKQLPESGDLLIITKALKDVMSIHDTSSIPSIGLQSENILIKDSVMEEYKYRFKKVVCLFDNDKAGINASKNFSNKFNIPYILIPNYNDKIKDFSDLVKFNITNNISVKEADNLLRNLINKI